MSNKEAIVNVLSRLFERVNQSIDRCVAEEFLNSAKQNRWKPEEIAEAMYEYLQQDVRSSSEIYARQRILEEQFKTINLQFELLAENTKSLHELKNEIDSLKLEYKASTEETLKSQLELKNQISSFTLKYDTSINAIAISVDSIKNSSDILSSSITRLDQSTARLATNDSVRAMLIEVENKLVSKQDLESKVSALETKIAEANNSARIQFAIVIAGLFIGFIGIFIAIYPLSQNAKNSTPASTTQTPASISSPGVNNSSK